MWSENPKLVEAVFWAEGHDAFELEPIGTLVLTN